MYGLGLEPPLKSLEPFLSALAKRDSINIRATSPLIMLARHFHVHLIFVKNVFLFFAQCHAVTVLQCYISRSDRSSSVYPQICQILKCLKDPTCAIFLDAIASPSNWCCQSVGCYFQICHLYISECWQHYSSYLLTVKPVQPIQPAQPV